MILSLIICTYNRPNSVEALLQSISSQSLVPNEILIIDASDDRLTEQVLKSEDLNVLYHRVTKEQHGLTKQRNIGISLVQDESEIICFLDDDVILENNYFLQIIESFNNDPEIIGVGGYAHNEVKWNVLPKNSKPLNTLKYFEFDGYYRRQPLRDQLRTLLGLSSNLPPGQMPSFGHGRSSLPPTGKSYQVDLLIGMAMSFRKTLFSQIKFSEYFEGYGLYEDADFSLQASKHGKLVVNTAARLSHHHAPQGRPNHFKYGLMVVRNGYCVWRVKNPNPVMRDQFKWLIITLLLIFIRGINVFTGPKRKYALLETFGRKLGLISLIYWNKKAH